MQTNPDSNGYFPVALETLQDQEVPALDLYVHRDGHDQPMLYRSRSLPVKNKEYQELQKYGVNTLWLRQEDFEVFDQYLNQRLLSVIRNPKERLEKRCEATYNYSTQLMQQLFNSEDPERVVQSSMQVLTPVIEVIFSDTNAAHNFLLRASLDYRLYTHSVNVCLYGIGLAHRVLKISKPEALTKYGPGLLLHDIGKLSIPQEILYKEGRLNHDEWKIIKKHPENGLDMVTEFMEITKETETIILHHHERLDGSGYPHNLRGEQIKPAARICALVDAFDAISTNRPYQPRKASFHALRELREDLPHRLDDQLFKEFLHLFIQQKAS